MTAENIGIAAFPIGSLSFAAMCAWVLYDFHKEDADHKKHPHKIKKA